MKQSYSNSDDIWQEAYCLLLEAQKYDQKGNHRKADMLRNQSYYLGSLQPAFAGTMARLRMEFLRPKEMPLVLIKALNRDEQYQQLFSALHNLYRVGLEFRLVRQEMERAYGSVATEKVIATMVERMRK